MLTLTFLTSNINNSRLEDQLEARPFKECVYCFLDFLFSEYDGFISPNKFTKILWSFSGKSTAEYRLSYTMGETRHFLITIMSKYARAVQLQKVKLAKKNIS